LLRSVHYAASLVASGSAGVSPRRASEKRSALYWCSHVRSAASASQKLRRRWRLQNSSASIRWLRFTVADDQLANLGTLTLVATGIYERDPWVEHTTRADFSRTDLLGILNRTNSRTAQQATDAGSDLPARCLGVVSMGDDHGGLVERAEVTAKIDYAVARWRRAQRRLLDLYQIAFDQPGKRSPPWFARF